MDSQVADPVAGGGDGHAPGAVLRGEELGDRGPREGTPGGGEGGDGETGEGDKDTASLRGRLRVVKVEREVTDKGVDAEDSQYGFILVAKRRKWSNSQETHHHPGGTTHECNAATNLVHEEQASDGAGDVDGAQNQLSHVRVGDTG